MGFTDNILTARAFATRQDARIDARRELVALGGANLGAVLMHGMPVSSSGSRTAICAAAGGRTRAAGLVTAAVTAVAVLLLGPGLARFPSAALGAVVVYAALRLIDVGEFRRIAAFRRSELLIAIATTLSVVVVGVLQGVLIAIGISVLDLLRRVARPHDAIEGYVPGLAGMHDVDDYPDATEVPGLLVYRYDSPLFFANAEDFTTRALAAVDAAAVPGAVVRAQHRGDRRGRPHRRRRPRGAAQRAGRAAAWWWRWPGSSRTSATRCGPRACSTGSARTASSPRCPPPSRRSARQAAAGRDRPDDQRPAGPDQRLAPRFRAAEGPHRS